MGTVEYVDEDTFLISVSSMMGDTEILYLRRVPASEVPEKETVYLAYPLAEIEAVPDRSWTEVADYTLIDQVNRFNRSSSEYRIEVVTFDSATDLQLLMQILRRISSAGTATDWNPRPVPGCMRRRDIWRIWSR